MTDAITLNKGAIDQAEQMVQEMRKGIEENRQGVKQAQKEIGNKVDCKEFVETMRRLELQIDARQT